MEGIAGMGLQTGGNVLAIVVAEAAQDGPAQSRGVHRKTCVIELLAECRIQAADYILLRAHVEPLRRGDILPGEIAVPIPLRRGPLIDLPKVLRDPVAGLLARAGAR